MFRNLLVQFWGDESGAVIAIEYLMLGSVVAAGSVTGMTAVRDSVNDEYREMGNSVRELRQQAAKPAPKSNPGAVGGTTTSSAVGTTTSNVAVQGDSLGTASVPAPVAPVTHVTFTCP